MRLLPLSAFAEVFAPLRGRRVGLVDGVGNVGDHLIYAATRQLLDAFGLDWRAWEGGREGLDVLLLFGGGNLGPWYAEEILRREAALATGLPCVVLPQSVHGPFRGTFERVFVRERASLALCPGATLAPDLALGYDHRRSPLPPDAPEAGLFLRRDGEALFAGSPSLGDPAALCATWQDYLALAGGFGHVVTDRLHFAIAALVGGRRATLLPNGYHKNRAMWEAWLAGLGCGWADTPGPWPPR